MPEKLTLDQSLWKRTTIEAHKWPSGAMTALMYRPGDHLFTSATLTTNGTVVRAQPDSPRNTERIAGALPTIGRPPIDWSEVEFLFIEGIFPSFDRAIEPPHPGSWATTVRIRRSHFRRFISTDQICGERSDGAPAAFEMARK